MIPHRWEILMGKLSGWGLTYGMALLYALNLTFEESRKFERLVKNKATERPL